MLQRAKEPLEETAKEYISEEKEVKNAEEAIQGAADIIAESIRIKLITGADQKCCNEEGQSDFHGKKIQRQSPVYEMYYDSKSLFQSWPGTESLH